MNLLSSVAFSETGANPMAAGVCTSVVGSPDGWSDGCTDGGGRARGVEFIRPPRANDRQAADPSPRSNEFDPTGKASEPKVMDDFKLRKVG